MVGSASVFHQKSRPVDIVAADENTAVTFHDMRELTRSNPARARELYDRRWRMYSMSLFTSETPARPWKKR